MWNYIIRTYVPCFSWKLLLVPISTTMCILMCKGVSDQNIYMDYFALSGRSCENLNFLSSMLFKANGRDNPNFHNYFLEFQKNLYTFPNLRHLYYRISHIFRKRRTVWLSVVLIKSNSLHTLKCHHILKNIM
jgi:hypothetical protein